VTAALEEPAFFAGAAMVDITPRTGVAMSGFAARTTAATGTHDPLTARAVVVGDTAIVVADIIGFDAAMSARIRARAPVPPENVVVAALHTHGGPVSMPGRLGDADPGTLDAIEEGCIAALHGAAAARRPCRMAYGVGHDPCVAHNRRRPDGPRDGAVPVIEITDLDGRAVASIVSHACHPVVLGADNTLWTADYPGFVRREMEAAKPGSLCMYLTGCAGDLNTGHSAQASFSTGAAPRRTFEEASRIGRAVAASALSAPLRPVHGAAAAADATVHLNFARRDTQPALEQAELWRSEFPASDPGRAALLRAWIGWAETAANAPMTPAAARVSVLRWGSVLLAALPGEPFCRTGMDIQRALGGAVVTLGYADSCPGYLPPRGEYAFGGYEVDDAHRYYGMPAPFAPGCAETLADEAVRLGRRLRGGG
jgi:hypothetical protein